MTPVFFYKDQYSFSGSGAHPPHHQAPMPVAPSPAISLY